MRKVNKNFHDVPDALQQGFEDKRASLERRKSEHDFDGRIYNSAIKEKLEGLYIEKCAYCESFMSDNEFTVEHYRPKSGDKSYYWLGYEWSNLLPVCKQCNHPKGDKFPVGVPNRVPPNSERVSRRKKPQLLDNGNWDLAAMKANHDYLLAENPYLLHPEIDNPQEYMYVNRIGKLESYTTEVEDKFSYDRVDKTIELTNLNRDTLVYNRRKLIEGFERSLKKQTTQFLEVEMPVELYDKAIKLTFYTIFENIEEQFDEKHQYTLTTWSIYKRIKEVLFAPIFDENEEIEKLLDYAFDSYMQSKEE